MPSLPGGARQALVHSHDAQARPGYGGYLDGISPRRRAFDDFVTGSMDRVTAAVHSHWLLVINVGLGLFVGVAVLVPALYALGLGFLAVGIFHAYHLACAQIPSHSYYLFGYQLALCARNLAIYGSLFLGSVAYRRVRAWLPPLDWRLWLLTMVPMAWDGGTQMFGLRESNWELRTVTGVLFGFGVCWFVLPLLHGAAGDSGWKRDSVTLDLRRFTAWLHTSAIRPSVN